MAAVADSEGDEQCLLNMIRYFQGRLERPLLGTRFSSTPQLFTDLLSTEPMFVERFGISPEQFDELYDMLEARLNRYRRILPANVTTKDCVAITLRFLASGLTMQDLGRQYNMKYSKILCIVRVVSKIIVSHLMPVIMPIPNQDTWERNAEGFLTVYDMPNCIGAIEGKNLFVGRSKIAFLAIVDAYDRFVLVDVGYYRKNLFHGDVMRNSMIGKNFMKNVYNVPESRPLYENSEPVPFVILGSSLFPSKPYLMTKHSRPECAKNDLNKVFNTRISRAKLTANRALLRLRNKWRIFQGPLPVPKYLVKRIVVCCCCLQNLFARRIHGPITLEPHDSFDLLSEERIDSLLKLLPEDSNDTRAKFKRYFLSPTGLVPWQWQDIPL